MIDIKFKRHEFKPRLAICALLVIVYLLGSYQETRSDEGGWCVHFNGWMVCNSPGSTDYILGD